jgi:hypothetical protein
MFYISSVLGTEINELKYKMWDIVSNEISKDIENE